MATPIRTPETTGIYGAPRGLEEVVSGLPSCPIEEDHGASVLFPYLLAIFAALLLVAGAAGFLVGRWSA